MLLVQMCIRDSLSNEASLKSFFVWTMVSLGDVTLGQLGLLLPAVVLGLVLEMCIRDRW